MHTVARDISERKGAEQALHRSEARFAGILDIALEAIISIDETQKIIIFNRGAEQIFGYSSEEAVGQSLDFLLPKKFRTIHRSHIAKFAGSAVASRRMGERGEIYARRKNGEEFPAEASISKLEVGGERIFTVVLRDISKRKRAEEALRESKERFRITFEQAAVGIAHVAPDGRFLRINQRFCDILGYTQEEMLSHTFQDITHADDLEADLNHLQQVLAGKIQTYLTEKRYIRKNGSLVWVTLTVVLVREPSGDPKYFISVVEDISQRKRAEEALRESEEKYRTLFEKSKDVVFISTAEGKLMDINSAGVELFGYGSKDELLKVNIAQELYVNPLDREIINQILEEKGFVKDYELVLKKKDGQKITVLESATVVRDEHGKVTDYRGIIHDLTERKQLEEQLLHAQKMESIGTLVGGIAHDFNNLLTVILGNVEFGLQDSTPDKPIYRDLQRIERAATQAHNLVSQLLSFSRRQVIKPKHLDLNKTIEEFLEMLKRIIGEDIELKTNLYEKIPAVWADPVQMQQVLMNLCVNARDAMPEGGKLLLETREVPVDEIETLRPSKGKSRNYVQITIIDTGMGMDKETRTRVFEPFFTTREVGKGTGLGLSVVYGIVQQHHGHIEVSSENGKGTSFKIYLPVKQMLQSSDHGKRNITDMRSGDETILVVEDEEAVRKVTVRILESLGYSVLTARSGKEGIKTLETRHGKIDLVILDVVLPELSGPEVYLRMRSLRPNLHVLLVTGYDIKAQLNELSNLSQEDIRMLQKPYAKETLGKAVREILDLQ